MEPSGMMSRFLRWHSGCPERGQKQTADRTVWYQKEKNQMRECREEHQVIEKLGKENRVLENLREESGMTGSPQK